MVHPKEDEMTRADDPAPKEQEESLFRLALCPSIWAVHFLACYITVALWCEKMVPPGGELGMARWLCVGYSAAALIAIAAAAKGAHRRHRFLGGRIPHDFDSPVDRHRFLGFAEFLLALLSFVAVTYVALPFGVFSTCR